MATGGIESSGAKKRARYRADANRTRHPEESLIQPKINRELLDTDVYNLWVHWTTKTWAGKYNSMEPVGLTNRQLARFTRWWTTVRGWDKAQIPNGLFERRNMRMGRRVSAAVEEKPEAVKAAAALGKLEAVPAMSEQSKH